MAKQRVVLLGLTMLLSACLTDSTPEPEPEARQSPAALDTAIPTSTESPNPTVTVMPTSIRTPTVSPSPSPTLAPTPEFGAAVVGDDFLFGNQPPGCELPCWQGLRVGESNTHDVENMFEEAFGFVSGHNLLARTRPNPDVSELLNVNNRWDLPPILPNPGTPPVFNISVEIDAEHGSLETLSFSGTSQRFEPHTVPQRVLRELGSPSEVLVTIGASAENLWSGGGWMMFFYFEEGITTEYYFGSNIYRANKSSPGRAELCLGSLLPSGAEYWVVVYLTRPFRSGLSDLSPLQADLFESKITEVTPRLRPLEEVFEITPEELTNLAQQYDNACILADVP